VAHRPAPADGGAPTRRPEGGAGYVPRPEPVEFW